MIKIDAVDSDGDQSIRKRRKELIKRSQNMLDLVDEFKNRDKKSPAASEEAVSPIEIATVESESAVAETSVEPESAATEAQAIETIIDTAAETAIAETAFAETAITETAITETEELAELESLSDIESLPEVHEVSLATSSVATDPKQEAATPEAASETQSDEEAESDASLSERDHQELFDPLDLIVDAALELTHPELLDHDFEVVSVH
ncbi:hypothetical protein MVEG_01589 [Podila verticillata NRRL 6337]|nr:hypothetical protein MVEG_01589 [Podila verticillata NRRL 6337]